MKTFVYVCLVVLCAVAVAQAQVTPLVKNGSFEYPYAHQSGTSVCGTSVPVPPGSIWFCYAQWPFAGMEWTVEWVNGGSPGILEFWRHPNVPGVAAHAGLQLVELDTQSGPGGNSNVRIHQSIATCTGADYTLSYWYRSRYPGTSDSFAVRWDGVQVVHTNDSGAWTQGTRSFQGKFGSAKLEFEATGSGDTNGMLLDDVSLTGPNPADANACTTVNIKPGSDPNSINVCSSGTVPVTIWGSATFDVWTIDPTSLKLGDAQVNAVGGKTARYQCSISDVGQPQGTQFDGIGLPDGYPDLTCHFETAATTFSAATTSATVSMTVCENGFAEGCTSKPYTAITATDAVRIVKDDCQ